MKTKHIATIVLCLLAWGTRAQTLINTKNNNVDSKSLLEVQRKERANKMYISFEFVEINLNVLTQPNDIEASFFDSKMSVSEVNKYVRDIKDYTWFGRSSDFKNSITISVKGKIVQGIVRAENELYQIETLGEEYVLFKINQTELNKIGCGDASTAMTKDSSNTKNPLHQTQPTSKSVPDFKCRMRILVMYTPAAKQNVSDMNLLAQLCIDQMNQTFVNSQVNAEAELAHVQLTEYTEMNVKATSSASHDDDLSRFTNDGDGYMDEVHTLRTKYAADACVLICDIDEVGVGYSGRSRSIKASAQYAFSIVDYFFSYINISFAHEVAHLIGCRHEQYNDTVSQPYLYGHGYENGSWRTIMATTEFCENCPRLPYWSNPNVTAPLFGVTGTALLNDNARVLNENVENFMSLRTVNTVLIVDQNEVNTALNQELYSPNKIITSGNVIVNSPQGLAMYAGNEIELLPGFQTASGSNFVAQIVPTCGSPDGLPTDYGLSSDPMLRATNSTQHNPTNSPVNKVQKIMNVLLVFPNPTNDEINISIEPTDTAGNILIQLTDYNGNVLDNIYSGSIEQAKNGVKYSLAKFSKGIYFIVLSLRDGTIVSHKTIKQ